MSPELTRWLEFGVRVAMSVYVWRLKEVSVLVMATFFGSLVIMGLVK